MAKDENTRKSILIVDDEPSNIQLLGKILEKSRHSVAYALDGKSTLKMVRKRKFDLILLDIMLPDIDGFEVCRMLMEDDESKEIPVIFITARSEIENVIRGFKVGGVDYVTKPFNELELSARISTQLELKSQRDKLKEYLAAVDISNRNRLQAIYESLGSLSEVTRLLDDLDHKTRKKFRNEVSGIKKILASLNESLADGDNEKSQLTLMNDFRQRLYKHFPGLTPNEKRLCDYLRSGMTTREISRISSHSVRAVEAARSRLRKKMKLGKDENLVHFLTQL